MKLPLRLKILYYLKAKIEDVPEGGKIPKKLLYTFRFVVWLLTARSKVVNFIKRVKNYISSRGLIPLIRNVCFVFFTNKSQARIFSGWLYRWLSVRYADKRSNMSRVNKLCGGKRHYVIDYEKDALIVINKLEINRLKTKGMFRKSYNILDVFENAYYVTK